MMFYLYFGGCMEMRKNWIIGLLFMTFLIGCQAGDLEEKSTANEDNIEETTNNMKANEKNTNDQETEQENQESDKKMTDGALTLHYIDAGQGDATLLQYEGDDEQYTILYDTGDWLGSEVVPYLEQEDVDEIDIVIISHPHADHIGQLKPVLENVDVGEVWMSGNDASSGVFTEAMEAVENSEAAYEEPSTGDVFDVGPLELTVLHPEKLTGGLNEDSLSIHFQFGETAFLFTGDAYKENEQEMIAADLPIKADVLQLGHHGSDTSSSSAFIEAVQPEIAIYSAGADNSYGHPHEETVSLFEEKGIPLYGTDKDGTVIVVSNGKTVDVESAQKPEDVLATEPESEEEEKEEEADKNDEAAKVSGDCIDINNASETELTEIIHIGEVRAKDLIEQRPYDSVSELKEIKGIGDKTLEDIISENKACVEGE